MFIAVLGRQPEISFAELAALRPEARRFSREIALTDSPPELKRLGGTIKIAEVVAEWPRMSPHDAILRPAQDSSVMGLFGNPRAVIGLSLYGMKFDRAAAMQFKRELQAAGFSPRLVLPTLGSQLNAAQVTHNHLTGEGVELLLVSGKDQILVAKTLAVQDVEAYSARDYGRPTRPGRVGMMPPKLCQILINLTGLNPPATIWDPFCGAGSILQEALLMGFEAIGSDLDPAMEKAASENLRWLSEQASLPRWSVRTADARSAQLPEGTGAVVSEGWLGPPLTRTPAPTELSRMIDRSTALTHAFLNNLHHQVPAGFPVVLTLPAWRTGRGFRTLNLDQISALGYTLVDFSASPADFVWQRPDQVVGRQIARLRSK